MKRFFIKNIFAGLYMLALGVVPFYGFGAAATGSLSLTAQAASTATIDFNGTNTLNLGTWNGIAVLTQGIGGVCLYTNKAGSQVKLTMTSANTGTGAGFYLKNTVDQTMVAYNPTFIDKNNVSWPFTSSGDAGSKTVSASAIANCNGATEMARLSITLPPLGTSPSAGGTYQDTLTLTVSAT